MVSIRASANPGNEADRENGPLASLLSEAVALPVIAALRGS
jgi:hypothetical protein